MNFAVLFRLQVTSPVCEQSGFVIPTLIIVILAFNSQVQLNQVKYKLYPAPLYQWMVSTRLKFFIYFNLWRVSWIERSSTTSKLFSLVVASGRIDNRQAAAHSYFRVSCCIRNLFTTLRCFATDLTKRYLATLDAGKTRRVHRPLPRATRSRTSRRHERFSFLWLLFCQLGVALMRVTMLLSAVTVGAVSLDRGTKILV